MPHNLEQGVLHSQVWANCHRHGEDLWPYSEKCWPHLEFLAGVGLSVPNFIQAGVDDGVYLG
eukprot:2093023-Karenia_brevis.AAC.1